jgi:hypothetical protein
MVVEASKTFLLVGVDGVLSGPYRESYQMYLFYDTGPTKPTSSQGEVSSGR